jgi:hypothetical protein
MIISGDLLAAVDPIHQEMDFDEFGAVRSCFLPGNTTAVLTHILLLNNNNT